MKRKNSTFKIIVGVVVLVVAVLSVVGGIMYYNYYKENNYVATIAGDKISEPEFKFFLTIIKNNYESEAGVNSSDDTAVKDFWKTPIQGENAEVKAKNDALEKLKEFKILLIKAKESKTQLDSTELDTIKKAIDQIITDDGNGNRAAASAKIKRQYGITLDEYESIYKNYMLAYGKYAKQLTDAIPTTDKDLKDYYDKNKTKFGDFLTKHILFMTIDPQTQKQLSSDQIAAKKKLAEDTYQKIKDGGDFDALIKQYSEDTSSKDSGGEFKISKDDANTDQKVRDWASNAKAGDVGLVEASYGFHILKYVKKIEYNDISADVKSDYQTDQATQKVEGWKKDAKYNLIKNQKVLDKIKVV